MSNLYHVNQILDFAAQYGWTHNELFDACMKVNDYPVVHKEVNKSKTLRNSIIALVLALLAFGIALYRFCGL